MFIYFLRDRTECKLGRGREREGDTESEEAPGSELSAQSPTLGSNPQAMNEEIMT